MCMYQFMYSTPSEIGDGSHLSEAMGASTSSATRMKEAEVAATHTVRTAMCSIMAEGDDQSCASVRGDSLDHEFHGHHNLDARHQLSPLFSFIIVIIHSLLFR